MKDKKSIIILYSKGLYDTNALDLADELKKVGSDCHVLAIADDKYTNFGRSRVMRGCYKFSIRNCRWMYSCYSNMTAKKKAASKVLKNIKADPTERTGVGKFAYDLTCRYYKVKNILRRYEPDIVLCFTPNVLKSAIKANEQLRMYTTKIYACLTDFALDMRFFNRRTAGYLVQNIDIKKRLVGEGIDENKIFVTSILADKVEYLDKASIKSEIGIMNDKPCVLLVGGRYGASAVKSAFSTLINYTEHFNIIMLSGGSKTIVNMARSIAQSVSDSVFVINSVDNIAKLYNVADIVVATPTSCICSEVLAYGKTLILLKGAGQMENANQQYLLSHNYALDGTKKEKLIVTLSDVILNGAKLNIGQYVNGGDIKNVAQHLLNKADEVFEEKKILIAEQELKDAEDIDDYVIEEVDNNMIEAPDDGVIIDEYNDLEEN